MYRMQGYRKHIKLSGKTAYGHICHYESIFECVVFASKYCDREALEEALWFSGKEVGGGDGLNFEIRRRRRFKK